MLKADPYLRQASPSQHSERQLKMITFSEPKTSEKLKHQDTEKKVRRHSISREYLFHSKTDKSQLGLDHLGGSQRRHTSF